VTRLILSICTALTLALSLFVIGEARTSYDAEPFILPIPPAQTSQTGAQEDKQVSASEQTQHRAVWLQAVLARPLFEPSRRPPAEGHSVAAGAPGLPRLSGVIVTPTGRQAIFAGSGKPVIVAEGATLDGFTVRSITAGEVTVIGANGVQVLHPSFDPNQPTSVLASGPRPFGAAGLFGSPPPPPIPAPLPGAQVGDTNLVNNFRGRTQLPLAGNVPTGTQ